MNNAAINPVVNLGGVITVPSTRPVAAQDDATDDSFPLFAPEQEGPVAAKPEALSVSYDVMDAATIALRAAASKKLAVARTAMRDRLPAPDHTPSKVIRQHSVVADTYADAKITFTNDRGRFKQLTGLDPQSNADGVCTAGFTAEHGIVVGVFNGDAHTMVHECVHASHVLMKATGIDARNDFGEGHAYLTAWLCREGEKVLRQDKPARAAASKPVARVALNRVAADAVTPSVKGIDPTAKRSVVGLSAARRRELETVLKNAIDQLGTIAAHIVTPEEEARNDELERQRRVKQASGDVVIPTAKGLDPTAKRTVAGPTPHHARETAEACDSIDAYLRDSDAQGSVETYFHGPDHVSSVDEYFKQ